MKRSVLLDVARSIAVLMVIAHHIGYRVNPGTADVLGRTLTKIGWAGVDLFFVISGYFVATILFSERETLKGFFVRRLFRIAPLYQVAVLFFVILTALGFNTENLEHVWTLFLFLTGVTASFNPMQDIPFLITWSITVEIFFYTLSALFFILNKRKFLIYFFTLYIVSFFTRLCLSQFESIYFGLYYFFPLLRLDAFAVGILLCWIVSKRTVGFYQGLFFSLAATVSVVWLVSSSSIESSKFAAYGYTCLAVLYGFFCFGLISIESCLEKEKKNLERLMHIFISIGKRSYFFYLFHLFFIAFVLQLSLILVAGGYMNSGFSFWMTYSIVIFLVYPASWLSWVHFEKPLIDFSRKF